MTRVPVNLTLDYTAGVLTHTAALPPTVPTPVPNLSVEIPAPHSWSPGVFTNKVKLTSTVRHALQAIVLMRHDLGPALSHVTLPLLANVLLPKIILFSKRKVAFTASTVRMNGKPVGCVTTSMPMIACGDPVSAPTAYPLTSSKNTVRVGMTSGDVAAGVVNIAGSILIDAVFFRLKTWKKGPSKIEGTYEQALVREVAKQAVKEYTDAKKMAKKFLSSLVGFGTSLMTEYPTFKFSVGHAVLRGGAEVSRPRDRWQAKVSAHAFGKKASRTGPLDPWRDEL